MENKGISLKSVTMPLKWLESERDKKGKSEGKGEGKRKGGEQENKLLTQINAD